MIILPQSPNKMRFKRDRHSREHRERIAEENKQRQRISQMVACSEAMRPKPKITLPRLSIQEDAE